MTALIPNHFMLWTFLLKSTEERMQLVRADNLQLCTQVINTRISDIAY